MRSNRIHVDTIRTLLAIVLAMACGSADPASAPEPEAPSASDGDQPMPPRATHHVLLTDPSARAVVIDRGYQLVHGTSEDPLQADAEGRLELPESPDEAIVLLWASGRAAARFELPADPGEHRVPLPDPTPLRGRLQQATGDGVTEVWLQAASSDAPWPYFVRCAVAADGRFLVNGLAGGAYHVSAVPIGGAPVLAADEEGRVRFLAEDPGPMETPSHRLLDREIAADDREHVLGVAFGLATVVGRVVDESGAPVAGASVDLTDESGRRAAATADARGWFSAGVQPAPAVQIAASHPDFGEQWTDFRWDGWRRYDAIPDAPIELVLRRGVVLRGRARHADGRPFANETLLALPAYVGSGPSTVAARTDDEGRFAFDPMVLDSFELVPRSVRYWHPSRPGDWLRVEGDAGRWLEAASAGDELELTVSEYTLLRLTLDVSALGAPQVQVWIRRSADDYIGSAPRVGRDGTVEVVVERGVAHDVWVERQTDGPLVAPWTRDVAPTWSGTPERAFVLTVP